MVSKEFLYRLKMCDFPAYRVAQKARVNPATLSSLIHGARTIRPNDRRIIAVGRVLGLRPEECFIDAVSSEDVQ